MVRKVLIANSRMCVGCYSCEIACREINKLPEGVYRIKVVKNSTEHNQNSKQLMNFKLIRCMQCERPQCLEVCPTKALKKQEDGIVVVDKSLCNGCKKCIEACPIHAIWFNPETGIIEKCDVCADKNFEIPFCVKHCSSKALNYIDPGPLSWIPW